MIEFFLLLTWTTLHGVPPGPTLTMYKSNSEAWDICHGTRDEISCKVYRIELKPRKCTEGKTNFECFLEVADKGPLIVTMTNSQPNSPQTLELH